MCVLMSARFSWARDSEEGGGAAGRQLEAPQLIKVWHSPVACAFAFAACAALTVPPSLPGRPPACALAQGTFGQVVSCWSDDFGKAVAVKVIKNQPAYYHQVRARGGAQCAREAAGEGAAHVWWRECCRS